MKGSALLRVERLLRQGALVFSGLNIFYCVHLLCYSCRVNCFFCATFLSCESLLVHTIALFPQGFVETFT